MAKRWARAVLVGPALPKNKKRLAQLLKGLQVSSKDLLIAIDGGLKSTRAYLRAPDIAIGDWDSLKNKKLLEDVAHVTLPKNKDRSDLYFALDEAVRSGAREVVCVGVTGARPDHHFASLLECAQASYQVDSVRCLDEKAEYILVSEGRWRRNLKIGQLISLFALPGYGISPHVRIRARGLKFKLSGGILVPSSHGLSNVVVSTSCEVVVQTGTVLIVIPRGT